MVNKKTIIIAEAGVNHNGDLSNALKLVDHAVEAGADIVKFQTFKAEDLVLKNTKRATYQIQNTKSKKSQFSMLKSLEMTDEMHLEIYNYCNKKNIEFLSTAFDTKQLDYLIRLGIKRIKVPSGEITNLPFLQKAASYNIPIIISTGMSTIEEINEAHFALISAGISENLLTYLHCTSNYPTELKFVNLRAMLLIANKLNVKIGYSDHTLENEASIAAVSLGAKIIEKHITIDQNMTGPDHKASIEVKQFKELIQSIRKIEVLLGEYKKTPNKLEIKNSLLVRKSIVCSRNILRGETFTLNNLTIKRPGTGLSPMKWYKILGTKSKRNYLKDELIDYEN